MEKTALIIGRFEPLHLGHLKLIQIAAEAQDVKKLIIGIGSSQFSHTLENPFSASERREMIKKSLKQRISLPYQIFEIPDIGDDKKWVSHLESIVGKFDLVYSNSEWVNNLFIKKGYEVRTTGFFYKEKWSGREIRRRIGSEEKWENLVSPETLKVMKKIKAEERIKKLNSSQNL